MTRKTHDAVARADRVLIAALAIILATASAAVGASFTYGQHTDQIRVIKVEKPVVRLVQAPSIPAPISIRGMASDVVLSRLLAEHRCLSEVMYFEARGEGEEGQKAVAEVIFHRMNKGNYGHSICAVVYEGVGTATCQFSFVCDGKPNWITDAQLWREILLEASTLLNCLQECNTPEDPKGSLALSTHYHAVSVSPRWSKKLHRTGQIGNHIFYRS
jgi:hypothetical protein